MNDIEKFLKEKKENISKLGNDKDLIELGCEFVSKTAKYKYSYNFNWLGRPIIQFPQDIIAMQEIIWSIKPDLIIETGVAHGGSLIFYSSILELIGKGEVLGIDIEIRPHNRKLIQEHPMFKRITMIEGSSISNKIIKFVEDFSKSKEKIIVCLDSNHTHEHVLKELELYSQFVSKDCYLIVFDTIIEDLPDDSFENKPWSKGNNPKTAVKEFLKSRSDFIIDKGIDNKLVITVAPDGYLKRIK